MPVHPTIGGIAASILINGVPAPEFNDPDEIQVQHEDEAIRDWQIHCTASKYIQVVAHQPFSIRMKVGRPLGHIGMPRSKLIMDVVVDGINVWQLICDRPWFRNNKMWEGTVAGPKTGKGRACTETELVFSPIQISDDDTITSNQVKRQSTLMKCKGTITITVWGADYGKTKKDQVFPEGFLEEGDAKISEKALKGDTKSLAASLGDTKKASRGAYRDCKKKDGPDWPVAIFIFKYRDRDALQQMHIIPRDDTPSPTPSPSPSTRSSVAPSAAAAGLPPALADMSDAEIAQMLAIYHAAKGSTAGRSTGGRIKQEPGEKRRLSDVAESSSKRLKIDKDGAIDLVSDDEDEEAAASSVDATAGGAGGAADSERDQGPREVVGDGTSLFLPPRPVGKEQR